MYQLDFNRPEHVHFIGIGGISMSGLAEVLLGRGFRITGSDSKETELTLRLEEKGARIAYGQRAENIAGGIDVVVYTAAIHPDNPEFAEAVRQGIPMLTRAELLGQMMQNYPVSVAVSGTHGKTSTTSMVTHILLQADMDPTISVGGMLDSIGGNIRVGQSGTFVTEACEYTNSFLSFYPTIEVILNMKEDHLDFFKDIEDIRHSFRLFAEKLPEDGLLVISSNIDRVKEFTEGLRCRVLYVGDGAEDDYLVSDICFDDAGIPSYLVTEKATGETAHITLGVPGEHNVWNSLSAIAVGRALGISLPVIGEGLLSYTGTHRRFEHKGTLGGVTIVDDYAHHPDEIRATLKTASKVKANRVVCVFQPHLYSRTKLLFEAFADALSLADVVVLADIYAAREKNTLGISSAQLADRLREKGVEAYYFPSFDEIVNFLLTNSINGDLLITMGAGDVVNIGEMLLGK